MALEKISLWFLLTLITSTMVGFVSNAYFHLPLTAPLYLLELFITGVIIGVFISKQNISSGRTKPVIKSSHLSKVIQVGAIMVITVNLITNLSLNLYWPPSDFDAIAMYDFRGRAISKENNLNAVSGGYEGSYPLFTSMFHAIGYEFGFENPKFFYSLIFICLVLAFISIVTRATNSTIGLLSGTLLTTTPILYDHAAIAYTNLSFTAYFGLGAVYLTSYLAGNQKFNGVMGSMLLGSSPWIRAATLPYIILLWLVTLVLNRRKKDLWSPVVLIPLFYMFFEIPWRYFQTKIINVVGYEQQGISAVFSSGSLNKYLSLLPETIFSLLNNLLNPNVSGGVGVLFIVTFGVFVLRFILTGKAGIHTAVKFLLSGLLIGLWIVVALLIFSYSKEIVLWRALVHDSMQRVYISFLPLMISSSASLLFEISRVSVSDKTHFSSIFSFRKKLR